MEDHNIHFRIFPFSRGKPERQGAPEYVGACNGATP
jgi:hypothetical protein